MTTTQTIELNDKERLALQRALGIIDNIATITNVCRSDVVDYLYKVAQIEDDREYYIKAVHDIKEIKKGGE